MQRNPKQYTLGDLDFFMNEFGIMLDYAVRFFKHEPEEFISMYLKSRLPRNVEGGNVRYVCGMLAAEMVWRVREEVLGIELTDEIYEASENEYICDSGIHYWVGSMFALYQWHSGLPFANILECVPISDFYKMFGKYHQMDEDHFLERMDELFAGI